MRENRPYGLEGGETETNRSSLPLPKNRSIVMASFIESEASFGYKRNRIPTKLAGFTWQKCFTAFPIGDGSYVQGVKDGHSQVPQKVQ